MTPVRWVTLAVVSAATAMLLLDVTIVYVALPAVQKDLGASFSQMQWVIDAYTVILAATLLGAGVLADRAGRRRVFVWGLSVFTLFSALCGLSGSALLLDLSRGAQGLGAAAMFSSSLAVLAHEFQGRERAFALGIWGAVTGASLAVGPFIGGLVVDGLGWRWIFLVNLPIGILLIGATLAWVQESREEARRRPDFAGIILLAVACLIGVFGLIRGNEDGWSSVPIILALVASVVLVFVFLLVERRSPEPILPLDLFRIPAFSGTALVAFSQSIAIYPLLLFLAIYFQDALGYSATGTGLRLMPMTLAIFLVAPVSGKLTGRVPVRIPLVSGLVLLGAGLVLMHGVESTDAWTRLLPGMLVGGVAIGMISPALAAAMVGVLPVERSGLSSGVNNTFRQLGIAFGVAGLGAVFHAQGGLDSAIGIADGLNAVIVIDLLVVLVSSAVAWPLLGKTRAVSPDQAG